MSDENPAAAVTPADVVDPGEAALAAAIADAAKPDPETVDSLPEWAQKIIRDTRQEAATFRTSAKTAAERAAQEMADKVGALLGLKPDLNPDVLAQSLAQSQQEAAQRARELAVYKAAGVVGADPTKLLDSNSVMSAIADIDAADPAALTAAIKAAVAANPYLKAAQAAPASGTPLAGSGEQGQLTEEQFAAIANDPYAIVAAQKSGLLKRILGS